MSWFSRRDAQVVGLVLAAKLVILVFGTLVAVIVGGRALDEPRDLLTIWQQWDATIYIGIASDGYASSGPEQDRIAFFPLYPLVSRAVAIIVPDVLASAFAVATVASVLAGVLLYRLALHDLAEDAAFRSVWAMLIFPTSYVLHTPHTESLFLVFVLGAFLAQRASRWVGAGSLGALASLTRPNGILLVPALAVHLLELGRSRRLKPTVWLSVALVPLGTLTYFAIVRAIIGDAFGQVGIVGQRWERFLDWPTVAITRTVLLATTPSNGQLIWAGELLFTSIAIAAAVWCALRFRLSYAVWIAGNLLLFSSTSILISVPRYDLVLFPLFMLLGRAMATRRVGLAVTLSCVPLLFFYTGRFVLGQWGY